MSENTAPTNGRIDPRPAQSVISIVGGLVVILGAVWGIMIRPIEMRLVTLEAAIEKQNTALHDRMTAASMNSKANVDRIDERSRDTADHVIAIGEQLQEIETQFRWFSQLNNSQHERDGRLLQLLWKNVYGEDLPPIAYWPEVGAHVTNGKK